MRVLVADDDTKLLGMLRHSLTRAGHDVETATDGTDALDKLRAGRIPVLVCDWKMPGLDGVELCRAVRSANGIKPATAGNDVYIIMLTCQSGSRANEGLSAGADVYITKPFDMSQLLGAIGAAERILGGP
jgi:DNA-binding response OmpR family regulator